MALLSGLLLVSTALAYTTVVFELHHWHAENGWIEVFQALVLAAGGLAHLYCFSSRSAAGFSHGILSLLCLSFVLRELDVEDFSLPLILIQLGSGTGRNIVLLTLWSLLAYRGASRITDGTFTVAALARRFYTPYFFIVVLLLAASAVFDQQLLATSHPRLFEELLEANAYLLLVLPPLSGYLKPGSHGLLQTLRGERLRRSP